MFSHQLNSKTNDLVLLFKTIWRYWNCFLLPVATDGMDGDGLKLEKIGQFFQVLMLCVPKILKKFFMVSPLWLNSFDIFFRALQKHFVYDLSLKAMILAQNWPKTAKSLSHCSFKKAKCVLKLERWLITDHNQVIYPGSKVQNQSSSCPEKKPAWALWPICQSVASVKVWQARTGFRLIKYVLYQLPCFPHKV